MAELVFAMLHGFRGGVVWVVSLIAIGGLYENRKRILVTAGVLTLFLVPLFPWLHSTMRYASLAAPVGTSRIDMIPFLIGGITDPSTITAAGDEESSFVDSWAIRAEGPRNSTTLYALYDQGEGASYRPILGSIVLLCPACGGRRSRWQAAPIPLIWAQPSTGCSRPSRTASFTTWGRFWRRRTPIGRADGCGSWRRLY